MQAEALTEDANVFDYDSWKDIEEKEKARNKPKKAPQKVIYSMLSFLNFNPENLFNIIQESRYIGNLLQQAEFRQRERARIIERKIQKEQEAEDHLYGDKEKFVTSA